MGKIDDIRKQREQRFAEMQRNAKAQVGSAGVNGTATPHHEPVTRAAPAEPDSASEERPPPATGREQARRPQKSALKAKSSFKGKSGFKAKGTLPSRADVPLEGKCSVCGKVKAMKFGLLVNHQKGFGKPCAGSRKKPA